MKIAVIFGGVSTEHDVSVISGMSVIKNLDKEKYDILAIYIDKAGRWYKYAKNINKIDILPMGTQIKEKEQIDNIVDELKKQDVVFPVLHGLKGEDGTIQGFLEILQIPYVGCGVLSSSLAMDKIYTKIILNKAGIKQAKSEYVRRIADGYIYIDKEMNEEKLNICEIIQKLEKNLDYPIFVKPSNSGSSVGVNKVTNKKELQEAINQASKYDKKILIEQGIIGQEVECAVLGNEEIISSNVGEIVAKEEFYSFDSKYKSKISQTMIPANLSNKIINKIKDMAIKAFKAIDGKGLARIDFFVEAETKEVFLNEINTMPGFTRN